MKSTTKTTLWKIYFFVLLLYGVFGYLWQGFSRFWEVADVIVFFIAILGLFAFIWKKTIFSKLAWKIYFFVQIMWNIFYLYFLPWSEKTAKAAGMSQFADATISLIFYIPLLCALYFYAFKYQEKNIR